MPSPSSVAVRRFAAVWTASLAVKIAAVALLLLVVLRVFGGSL